MNAAELIAHLHTLDSNTLILVQGYEDGFSPIASISDDSPVQELAGRPYYYPRFETPTEAARIAAQDPNGWIAMEGGPPTLVGPRCRPSCSTGRSAMSEPSPYLTVGNLRELLREWPDDRPVLGGTVSGEVRRVVYSCHERVQVTDAVAEFRTVARPPAEYMELDPPLPAPAEPFVALVLRGEDAGE